MPYIYLEYPDRKKENYYRFSRYNPINNYFIFGDNLEELTQAHDEKSTLRTVSPTWWNLNCNTTEEFLNHPAIFKFTKESHPELFI